MNVKLSCRDNPYEEGTESFNAGDSLAFEFGVAEIIPMKRELKASEIRMVLSMPCSCRDNPYEERTESQYQRERASGILPKLQR